MRERGQEKEGRRRKGGRKEGADQSAIGFAASQHSGAEVAVEELFLTKTTIRAKSTPHHFRPTEPFARPDLKQQQLQESCTVPPPR